MSLPSARDWLFSIKTFAAAMLAVQIGFSAALPRPYWAMATVYICSQPLSGATRSKATYRVAGTLVGAAATVILVPGLVNAPVLLTGALCLWVAGCLYMSLLDRSPRAYAFMLAGYTAALIGFPAVEDPGAIVMVAVARVEEITLGILCASLVSLLVFPQSVGAVVAERADAWLRDAARLSRDVLAGRREDREVGAALIRLAGDAAEIDMLSSHLPYDTSGLRDLRGHLAALRLRMLMLLPILSSIADRLAALRGAETPLPPKLAEAADAVTAWIHPGPVPRDTHAQRRDDADLARLHDRLAAAAPPLDGRTGWTAILGASLLTRLGELVDLAGDTRMLRRAVADGRRSLPRPLAFTPEEGASPSRHRDHAMALLSALGAALAIALCTAFWIASGWPDGASAPMLAAVACCFFASRDDPVPAILQFANWTGVAVLVMAVYQFALFPMAHDFPVLVLMLAPAFLLFGLLIARPATMGIGLALAANGSTLIALQDTFSADFASYANANLALMIGMYVSAVVMRLVRSVGADWAAWRLIGAGRRTLARAARHRGRQDRARFAGLMLDRIALLAPRLAAMEPDSAVRGVDVLAGLRIGLNIVDLRRARHGLPATACAALDRMLDALAAHYEGPRRPAAPTLLAAVDAALAATTAFEEGTAKRDALLGLVGLRRGLFPQAPPYRGAPPAPPPGRAVAA